MKNDAPFGRWRSSSGIATLCQPRVVTAGSRSCALIVGVVTHRCNFQECRNLRAERLYGRRRVWPVGIRVINALTTTCMLPFIEMTAGDEPRRHLE